jgi:hypothetical protein
MSFDTCTRGLVSKVLHRSELERNIRYLGNALPTPKEVEHFHQ